MQNVCFNISRPIHFRVVDTKSEGELHGKSVQSMFSVKETTRTQVKFSDVVAKKPDVPDTRDFEPSVYAQGLFKIKEQKYTVLQSAFTPV